MQGKQQRREKHGNRGAASAHARMRARHPRHQCKRQHMNHREVMPQIHHARGEQIRAEQYQQHRQENHAGKQDQRRQRQCAENARRRQRPMNQPGPLARFAITAHLRDGERKSHGHVDQQQRQRVEERHLQQVVDAVHEYQQQQVGDTGDQRQPAETLQFGKHQVFHCALTSDGSGRAWLRVRKAFTARSRSTAPCQARRAPFASSCLPKFSSWSSTMK